MVSKGCQKIILAPKDTVTLLIILAINSPMTTESYFVTNLLKSKSNLVDSRKYSGDQSFWMECSCKTEVGRKRSSNSLRHEMSALLS